MTLEERNAKLDEAKALVAQGWHQGSYQCNGSYCAEGAIIKVMDHMTSNATGFAAWDALSAAAKMKSGLGIVQYNDSPGRTQAHVLALFDLAKEQPL